MNEFESRRTIEEVLDRETGQIIMSKDFFNQSEDILIYYRRIQQEAINNFRAPKFICPHCYQTLKISGKKTRRGMVSFFAHLYDSEECEFKTNGSYSLEEIEALKYAGVKESQRHIELKNKLYQFLTAENSQNLRIENVKLESRLDSDNPLLNWRRPDVYAEYHGRKIVFELQLSTTLLSVIVARDNFYRLNETYIIWVFNFSENSAFVNLGNLMCKDIYYANKRNAFILDNEAIRLSEQEKELILLCQWFEPSVNDGQIVANEVKRQYIKLSDLQFDDDEFKPYFIDADTLFLKYNPELLIKRKNLESENEKWLKILEIKAIERAKSKDALRLVKIEKIKKELLQGKCKLKPFELNSKWGFRARGEIIVPPIYEYVEKPDDSGYAAIKISGKWGYIDQVGREVIKCDHDNSFYKYKMFGFLVDVKKENQNLLNNYGLFKWIKDGFTGLTDEFENERIPFIYDEIRSFKNNKAEAKKNGLWGYIDIEGKEIIPFIYDEIYSFKNNKAEAKKNGLWGYIDIEGNEIIPFIYDSIFPSDDYGYSIVYKNRKGGCIDQIGREVVKCQHLDIDVVAHYRKLVQLENSALWRDYRLYKWVKNEFTGLTDEFHNEIIPFIYDEISSFWNNKAKAKKSGLWGYVDIKGDEIIPFIYDEIGPFHDNIAKAKKNGLSGYIDINGNEVIPFVYNEIRDFRDEKAVAKRHSMWGCIDSRGNEVLPFIYQEIDDRSNGFYRVKYQDKWGYINYSGNVAVKIIYDEIGDFSEVPIQIKLKEKIIEVIGLAKYKYAGKRGYVNKSGREYWQYWK